MVTAPWLTGVLPAFLAASAAHLFAGAPIARAAGVAGVAASPLPFPATVESVVERGAIEGHPVSVARVRCPLSPAEAVASTRRAWGAADSDAVLVNRSGPWLIVSARERSGYRTLQLRDSSGGGSEGLLSLWNVDAAPSREGRAALDVAGLLPLDAQVLRTLEAVDGGRRHRTLVALAQGSVRWVADAIDSKARALGFSRDPVGRETPAGATESRLYRARGRELAFTVHPHEGRAAIVLHVTEISP